MKKEELIEFREKLEGITLKDLTHNLELQEELSKVALAIQDYLRMINPKMRGLFISKQKRGMNYD